MTWMAAPRYGRLNPAASWASDLTCLQRLHSVPSMSDLLPLRRMPWLCLAVLLLLASGIAGGAEVEGLYEVGIPVQDKTRGEQRRAFRLALEQVLVKVSGNRAPLAMPRLKLAFQKLEAYVQQFRYQLAEPDRPRAGDELPLVLEVSFDHEGVNRLLRQAGLPVWGRTRPAVLMWLALEQAEGRKILASDAPGPLPGLLQAGAAARGLPLNLPILDLEDQAQVRITDVWGGFLEPVNVASQRYGSDAVLVGKAYSVLSTLWEVRWSLMLEDRIQHWTSRADGVEALLEEGIHETADRLAAAFGRVKEGPSTAEVLVVKGLNRLEDYARVHTYLLSLERVRRVEVVRLAGERVSFRIEARGGLEALQRLLVLGEVLMKADGDSEDFQLRP